MKIMEFFTSRTGKMALSAMQAVGLSAAVGVAGIAAWQMLGSSSQPSPNTLFSSNDQEVVFVAGAAGAGAYGGNYGTGGELQSSIRTKLSKDMQLMQKDAQYVDNLQEPDFVQKEQQIAAYKMGGDSDGLGMGGNAAKELAAGVGGDMSAVQAQIAALQESVAAQQQAAAAAAGENVAEAARAQMQGKGDGRWGMAQGMAKASGSNLNATPLQAGQNTSANGGVSSSGVLGGAQIAGAAGSGATEGLLGGRQSRSSFGRALTWQGGNQKDDLASLQKQSSDIAQNKNRAANEGSKIFLASNRMAGGIMLNGESLTSGEASSSDFMNNNQLDSLGAGIADVGLSVEEFENAKSDLREAIKDYRTKVAISCGIAPLLCQLWCGRKEIRGKIDAFESQWGETSYFKDDTQGNYADDAHLVVNRIWWKSWGGPAGSLMMWNKWFGDAGDHVFGV